MSLTEKWKERREENRRKRKKNWERGEPSNVWYLPLISRGIFWAIRWNYISPKVWGEKIINVSSPHFLTSLALILFLCFPFLVPFPTSFFYVVPHSWVVTISRKPPWLSNLRLAVCAFKCIPSITDISVTVVMPHCFIISVPDSN